MPKTMTTAHRDDPTAQADRATAPIVAAPAPATGAIPARRPAAAATSGSDETDRGDQTSAHATAAASPAGTDIAHGSPGDSVPERVWNALVTHAGATAAELATAAQVGRSTVPKLLATWASEGRATSTTSATARAARHWTALPAAPPVAGTHTTTGTTTQAGASEQPSTAEPTAEAEPLDPPAATAAPRRRRGPVAGAAAGGPASGSFPPADAAASAGARAAAPRVPGTNRAGSARLGAGELRGLVEEFLAEHPGSHGPVEIGHALRRSSGAIANALDRLAETGWAELTNDRPKRYRYANADGVTAADAEDAEDATDTDGLGDSEGGGGEVLDDAAETARLRVADPPAATMRTRPDADAGR